MICTLRLALVPCPGPRVFGVAVVERGGRPLPVTVDRHRGRDRRQDVLRVMVWTAPPEMLKRMVSLVSLFAV